MQVYWLDSLGKQPDPTFKLEALLELLDQVEDVIAVEEPVVNNSRAYLLENQDKMVSEISVEANAAMKTLTNVPSERDYCGPSNLNLLVLEASEKHRTADSAYGQSPYKCGVERVLHLYDEWFYSHIGPGDTINVIGDFDDQGHCVVDRDNNLVIVHPDILVLGTQVAASFTCPRRTVLDERLKFSDHSTAALIGSLLHQIFQAGLLQESPTREFLEEYARIVVQKNVESLYACGVNENDSYGKLLEAIPRILNWLIHFRGLQVNEELN